MNPVTVGWVFTSLLGFLLECQMLAVALGDDEERKRRGVDGLVRIFSQQSIVTAAALACTFGAYAVAGVVSLADTEAPWRGWLIVGLLLLGNAVLIALAFYRQAQRRWVRRVLRAGARQDQRRDRRATDTRAPP